MPFSTSCIETFPALSACPGIQHYFIGRIPGLDVRTDRESALKTLAGPHAEILEAAGYDMRPIATGEQVHRAEVAAIREGEPLPEFPVRGVDALVTDRRDIGLGIYVADCAAVYLVDTVGGGIGLVHAGRKGVEEGIIARTIRTMQDAFGTKPANLLLQISPCIRPPHYEVDFVTEIIRHASVEGVVKIEDCGVCTANDLGKYYSYRKEKGRTGRMLAVLARKHA